MKRTVAVIAFAAISVSARAGVTYNFASVSSGPRETVVAGVATADHGHMRLDITRGDGVVLRSNTVALSIEGGHALRIIDPSSRTYYDVDLAQLLGGISALVKQLGGHVTLKVQNVRVSVGEPGDGGTIEGYATRRGRIDSEYDLELDAWGQKSTVHVATEVQSWTTDALPAEITPVFQLSGMKSGIADIDKLIESQGGAARGFPLKQITSVRTNEIQSTTTMTVSGIRRVTVDAAAFETPRRFRRARNPFAIARRSSGSAEK